MPFLRPYRLRATLTSKGQLTIPVELRRRWELKSGDQLEFSIDDHDRVVLRKCIRLTAAEMALQPAR
jgi:AbrB family looped-hinge helix DNA binding protein